MDDWSEVSTFADLCALGAGWLDGSVSSHFTQTSPDEETLRIADVLSELNRRGLFTTFSQPAEALTEDGFAQRAAVQGYAEEPLARSIYAASLSTDLIVMAFPPNYSGGYMLPITLDGFHPFTWCGCAEEIEDSGQEFPPKIVELLSQVWQVVAIDPTWGREDHLWNQLLSAGRGEILRFSSYPCDSHGLETDFVC